MCCEKILKIIVDIPCILIVLLPTLVVRLFNVNKRYDDISICLAYIPTFIGERIRYYFYKFTLASVGEGVRFKFGSCIQYRSVKIGSNVLVGYFNSLGECEIGDDVLLGGNVNIMSGLGQHKFLDKSIKVRNQGGSRIRVIIGDDVYIGSGTIVVANIANGTVVAAGGVIVEDTEEFGVYINTKSLKKFNR